MAGEKNYRIVRSEELSSRYESRFVVVDAQAGDLLDDAQGYGYRSKEKAHAVCGTKPEAPPKRSGTRPPRTPSANGAGSIRTLWRTWRISNSRLRKRAGRASSSPNLSQSTWKRRASATSPLPWPSCCGSADRKTKNGPQAFVWGPFSHARLIEMIFSRSTMMLPSICLDTEQLPLHRPSFRITS